VVTAVKKKLVSNDDDEFVDIDKLMRLKRGIDSPDTKTSLDGKEVKVPAMALDAASSATATIIPSSRMTLKSLREQPNLLFGLSSEALATMKPFLFPAGRVFKFNLGWLETITASASGQFGGSSSGGAFNVADFVNAPEWASLAALFDEVYLSKALCHYLPYSNYRANSPASNVSSAGMVWCDLHHNASVYTSASAMLSNPTSRVSVTNDTHFKHVWKNVDRVNKNSIDISKSGTAVPTQGWCSTNATSITAFTGQVQYIGTALIADWASKTMADVLVQYALWFRNRA